MKLTLVVGVLVGSFDGDTVGLGVTGDWVGSFKQSAEKRLSEQECIKIVGNIVQRLKLTLVGA